MKCAGLNKDKSLKMEYLLKYSLSYIIVASLVFVWFFIYGKSFIIGTVDTGADGLTQHYNALLYYGKYLRNILRTVFVEHSFTIPMWDLSIGYGSDIITTLSYYVIGDPLSLSAMLCPAKYTEYLYILLILLRIYLAGLAFSAYCKYFKLSDFQALIGATIYSFCGYTLIATLTHPYFGNPMIYLPLLLWGIEKIYDSGKPFVFILMVGVSAISNFYFFYMLVVLAVLYAIYGYCRRKLEFNWKTIVTWIGKFTGYALVGVLLSCIIFLPAIMSIVDSPRLGAKVYVPLLYDIRYYFQIITAYVIGNGDKATYLGYTVIGICMALTLFSQRKENTKIKIITIIMTILICIPFWAHIMNGFGYVKNRWIFGYSFWFCYMIAFMIPSFLKLSTGKRRIISILGFGLSILTYVVYLTKNRATMRQYDWIILGVIVLVLMAGLILICNFNGFIKSDRMQKGIIYGIVVVSIAANSYYTYGTAQFNKITEYLPIGTGENTLLEQAPAAVLTNVEHDENHIYRYDTANISRGKSVRNASMQLGLNGVCFYFSTTNNAIDPYYREMNINVPYDEDYTDLDGRIMLDSLASVKYMVVPKGSDAYLPYGYEEKIAESEKYIAYRTDNALPIAYVYEKYIPTENYVNLSAVEKQQALLEGVVLQKSNLPEGNPVFTNKEIAYKIENNCDGVQIEGNQFKVTKENARITLAYEGLDESETYLALKNFYFDSDVKRKSLLEDLDIHDTYIHVSNENIEKTVNLQETQSNYYCNRRDFICNMGYHSKKSQKMDLVFERTGTYTFDKLAVVCQPMDGIGEKIKELKEYPVQDLNYQGNRITGKVSLDKQGFVCFAIPYSKGWSAYVNGSKAEVMKANTMFLGIELEPGEHAIVLQYTTPYLKLGAGLSGMGIMLCLLLCYYTSKKEKRWT